MHNKETGGQLPPWGDWPAFPGEPVAAAEVDRGAEGPAGEADAGEQSDDVGALRAQGLL